MGHYQQHRGPSCLDQGLIGFALGGVVGATFGAIVGGYSCFRAGLRGAELLAGAGKTALQSGGAFGGFMAIGHMIRCEERKPTYTPPPASANQWEKRWAFTSNNKDVSFISTKDKYAR